MMKTLKKSSGGIINGLLGAAVLLAFYFIILRLTNSSWDHALDQFQLLQPYIILLDIGFGIQVGLYSFLQHLAKGDGSTRVLSGSAGVSAFGMVACCVHHVGDALPLIGLTGALFFLTEYQVWFMVAGIISNIAGIVYILRQIRRIKLLYIPT